MYKNIRVFLMLMMVLILLIAGCAGPSEETTTATTSGEAKPEGTLIWGAVGLGAEAFVPFDVSITNNSLGWLPVYDTLGYPSQTFEPIPSLAESWEFSDDFLTLTVHLREGIQFQDGWGELTAEDVKWTIQTSLDSPTGGRVTLARNIIDSMEVKDPYTLVIHQKIASSYLINLFAQEHMYWPILCKKYVETVGLEEANINPIGTGPYRLVEHKTGDYRKYEAADEHWRVIPEFKYLIIKGIPEESTRVAMLITGDIDATVISPPSVADIPEEGFTISFWGGGPDGYISFGGLAASDDERYVDGYHNQDPWNDVRVREAMNIAIDREAINQALYLGQARLATVTGQFPGWEDLEPYPYDPERARWLLDQAGYPEGFTLDFVNPPSHPGAPMLPKAAEAVAGYWEQIGITVNIIPKEAVAHFDNVRAIETAGQCLTWRGQYTANAEPNLQWCLMGAGQFTLFLSDALESLNFRDRITSEPDLEKRAPIYKELCQWLYDNYASIPLFIEPVILVYNNKKIGEWPQNWSTYYYDFEYVRHADPLNTWRLFTP